MTTRTHALFAVTFLAGALPACEDDPGKCKEDFDCPVGQVCTDATADEEGTCAEAAAGSERNFGRVTMEFADGTEEYLLGVFALPTGQEAAGSDLVRFQLSAGGTPAGALTLAPAHQSVAPDIDEDFWRDRIAFESARREGVARLVRDLRAGKRTLARPATKQAGCPNSCEDSQICWGGGCTSTPTLKFGNPLADLDCRVLGTVGTGAMRVVVLLDDSEGAGAESDALAAGTAFAEAGARVLQALGQNGHNGAFDYDNDGRMAVVFTEQVADLGAYAGIFQLGDLLPSTDSEATGNMTDLLWSRVPGTADTAEALAVGTLVHEYTHLANFAVRVAAKGAAASDNEVMWLDEGMAHLMEDLTGYGSSNIESAAAALAAWPTTAFAGPADTTELRGMAYTLLRYLVDRASGAGTAAGVSLNGVLPGVLLSQSERGFMHPVFAEAKADGIWQWLLATYTTNNPEVTEPSAQQYKYLPTAASSTTGQLMGFDPFGTGYVNASGEDLTDLTGPTLGDGSTDELTDFAEPFTSDVAVSQSFLYKVTGQAGTVTLTGRGDAFVDLQVKAQRIK